MPVLPHMSCASLCKELRVALSVSSSLKWTNKQCSPPRNVGILWGEMHKTFYTVADMQELLNIQY